MSNILEFEQPDGLSRSEATQTEWKHPSDHFMGSFVLDSRASLMMLGVFIAMMLAFNHCQSNRVHHRRSRQLRPHHPACRAVRRGAVGVRRHIGRNRPARFPRQWASRPGCSRSSFRRVRSVPRHRRRDPDRHDARLLRRLARVYAGLSSLIATLGMNFLLRGLIQIINEGKSTALDDADGAGPTRSSQARLSGSRSRFSGRSLSSSSPRSSTIATASARGEGGRDNPEARSRWAST